MNPELTEKIAAKYAKGVESGDVHFSQSDCKKLKDPKTGAQYMVTHAPSLLKKPERGDKETKNRNPFAEPEPELTVCDDLYDLGKYKLLLNKFPVVPEHLLLVTREFKPQISALDPTDLLTSYRLLQDLDDDDEQIRNLVFYNCGAPSGSSQDHKHMQVLRWPQKFVAFQDRLCSGKDHFIPDMRTEPLQDAKLSFAHFVVPLPEDEETVDEDLLAMTFVSLLQRTLTFFQDWSNEHPELQTGYNVLLTRQWMCLVPRSSSKSSELDIGFNATGYAGLVLVKHEDVWNKILEDPHVVDRMMLECGFPNTAGTSANEYNY
ncbi:LANO_0G00628g1_1 [Lachancea nothofagi CBS 11611]|uniref:LANO_0G00628g1_1 n=1 Tax=Lachancea nothofagi CBS 11611 TaxID=1266666 RepID=A0A1G4KEA3_9SACH|nr:LANO_0G00628g1_1 [Lachancea nothofagi CBS 11611]